MFNLGWIKLIHMAQGKKQLGCINIAFSTAFRSHNNLTLEQVSKIHIKIHSYSSVRPNAVIHNRFEQLFGGCFLESPQACRFNLISKFLSCRVLFLKLSIVSTVSFLLSTTSLVVPKLTFSIQRKEKILLSITHSTSMIITNCGLLFLWNRRSDTDSICWDIEKQWHLVKEMRRSYLVPAIWI